MSDQPRRPLYQDYQAPAVYRIGCSLRRSYLTGPAGSAEEAMMKRLLERYDEDRSSQTVLALTPAKAFNDRE